MIEATDAHVNRRGAIARIALLLGVTALPANVFAQTLEGTKPYLPAAQMALLAAVADTILPKTDTPGALAAKVPQRLDAMLANWAAPETREDVVGALKRIDDAARAAKGKGFAALSVKDRETLLRAHDAAALAKTGQTVSSGKFPFAKTVAVVDPGYLRLKDLVVDLYYYSPEAAATELVYEHVPGKYEPSLKLTPTSRPFLGLGPF